MRTPSLVRARPLAAGAAVFALAFVGTGPVAARAATASPTASVTLSGGALTITGSNSADTVTLIGLPPNLLDVNLNGEDFVFAGTAVTSVSATLNGGNDIFDEQQFSSVPAPTTVDGGNGADTITTSNAADTVHGGAGNDTIFTAFGSDFVDAGTGDDAVRGGGDSDTVVLGDGTDSFIWDPGDGSDTVEGQAGSDAVFFNGSNAAEHIALAANGNRVRLTRDVAAVTMDFHGVEQLALTTLGSSDNVNVGDLTGTDLRTARIDLAAQPGTGESDGAPDTVFVAPSTATGSLSIRKAPGDVIVKGGEPNVHVVGGEPIDTVGIPAG